VPFSAFQVRHENANDFRKVAVPVYVVLLHFPVVNRHQELVTTAVTNLDIHDIARTAKTYGAEGYFIVTPIDDQRALVKKILDHWSTEKSRRYHPHRFEALELVKVVSDFEAVKTAIRERHGTDPEVVMTDARPIKDCESYQSLRLKLESPEWKKPVALVFGTGWGISEVFYPQVHRVLAPLFGPADYNHLSVRAAVAAIMDRLFGR